MDRLENRDNKVTRILNYMLEAKNDAKALQCYYIKMLISQIRKRDEEERLKIAEGFWDNRKKHLNLIHDVV